MASSSTTAPPGPLLTSTGSVYALPTPAGRVTRLNKSQLLMAQEQGRYKGMKIEQMTREALLKALAAEESQEPVGSDLYNDKLEELRGVINDAALKIRLAKLVFTQQYGYDPSEFTPMAVTEEELTNLDDLRLEIRQELQTLRNNNESVASAYVSIEAGVRAFMSKLNMPVDAEKVADFTFDQLLDTYLKQAS